MRGKFSENSSDLVVPPFPKRCRRKCENYSNVKFVTFCPTNQTYFRGENVFQGQRVGAVVAGDEIFWRAVLTRCPTCQPPTCQKALPALPAHNTWPTQHNTLSHTICNTLWHTITHYHRQHTITDNTLSHTMCNTLSHTMCNTLSHTTHYHTQCATHYHTQHTLF